MKQRRFFLGLLIALPVSAQQAPIPDPRIEVALSATVVKETERSVAPEKTLPQPAVRAKPRVEEPDMAKLREGVYAARPTPAGRSRRPPAR
jgi:hypothetical protein